MESPLGGQDPLRKFFLQGKEKTIRHEGVVSTENVYCMGTKRDVSFLAGYLLSMNRSYHRIFNGYSLLMFEFDLHAHYDYSTNKPTRYSVCIKDRYDDNKGRVFKQTEEGWVEIES